MRVLKVYRKSVAHPSPLPDAATIVRVAAEIEAHSRVSRPDLVNLFLSGKFWTLPALSPVQVRAQAARTLDYPDAGWIVPVSNLGRVAAKFTDGTDADAHSVAQSVLLWIAQNLGPEKGRGGIVTRDEVSVVVEEV